MLFDPDRLNARMIWFEHVFLPSLQAQTDPDFTMIVLTSEDLPQPWLDRLRALIGALPQFRLQTMPPLAHRVACADAIKAVVEPGADLTAQFRLDDDDAVAVEYIALIRRDFLLLQALYSENNGLRWITRMDWCWRMCRAGWSLISGGNVSGAAGLRSTCRQTVRARF